MIRISCLVVLLSGLICVQGAEMLTRSYVIGQIPVFHEQPHGGGGGFGDAFGGEPVVGRGDVSPRRPRADESDLPWARRTANPEFLQQYVTHHLGVEFPEGSWLRYQRAGHVLHMHNTEDNHAFMKFGLISHRLLAYQVALTLRMVRFDDAVIEALERNHPAGIPDRLLVDLWREGEGEVLSSQSLKTINGVNAIIHCVEEFIYPTHMRTTSEKKASGAAENENPEKHPPVYGGHETMQIGAIFNITPTVSADMQTVNLMLLPETTQLKGDNPLHPPELQPMTPIFHSINLTTALVVQSGSTLVAGQSSDLVPGSWIVIFVGAQLVDTKGEPIELPLTPPEANAGEEVRP
ncbi:MAG: hypothetical protein JJU29_03715 [Verrucomicrobia bacterium]|nr:hypothetical protein [Verrucomicrobiota bacterium]MCH8510923.1 type II and III secretion system protein [Kiritimatiellia bacterium]